MRITHTYAVERNRMRYTIHTWPAHASCTVTEARAAGRVVMRAAHYGARIPTLIRTGYDLCHLCFPDGYSAPVEC